MATFTVGSKQQNFQEAVAYIDPEGDLIVRSSKSVSHDDVVGVIILRNPNDRQRPAITSKRWAPETAGNTHVFYLGDSVTITF